MNNRLVQLMLKWVALPALVGLFIYFFVFVNNSHSGSTCSGCGQHVKYYEGMSTANADTAPTTKVNKNGVVPYVQKDNGPGSPSQQAFRQQQAQQKKQNLNNTTFAP